MTLKQVIEALIFASPKPLSTKEIAEALRSAGSGSEDAVAQEFAKVKSAEVEAAIAEAQADLAATERSFQIIERVNGWTMVSDARCAIWVRQLFPEAKPTRLSGPQLETLAIIAYRQPVTRAEIEAVRGVAVDGVMQILLDRSLVKIAGRAEVPGRPLLYSTTEYFLEHFGLKNTDELPNATELKRVVLPTPKIPEEAGTENAPPAGDRPAEAELPLAPDGPERSGTTSPEEERPPNAETPGEESPAEEQPASPAS